MHCFICDSEYSKPVTNYPDGKDPCPSCVDAYKMYDEKPAEEGDLDTSSLEELDLPTEQERLGIFNIPHYDEEEY